MARLEFTAFCLITVIQDTQSVQAQVIGGDVRDYNSHAASSGLLIEALAGKSVVASATTDSSGVFYITVPKAGLYRLRLGGATTAPFFSDTVRVSKDGFVQARYSMDSTAQRVYYAFEVAKAVAPYPDNRAPHYPQALREKGVSGRVITRFVVDTLGYAIDETFAVVNATDPGFIDAVREGVRNLSFFPAELPNGRKVRQLVQMPFFFEMHTNAP